MKRTFLTVLTSLCTALVFAGGVENKTNMSTGYLRNPSRNTECSRPEAAFYNIAGTAFLEDGLYVEAGNQFIVKEYGNKLDTNNAYQGYGIKDYYSNDETTVFFYPDADIVFKKGRWSTFLTFGVYAGGGALSYSEGTSATTLMFLGGASKLKEEAVKFGLAAAAAQQTAAAIPDGYTDPEPNTGMTKEELTALAQEYGAKATLYTNAAGASLKMAQNHSLDVTSLTLGGQLGASYLITDWLSLSAAYRYTFGSQDMVLKCTDAIFCAVNGSNEISYQAKGFGQSMVFGIHAKPPVATGLDLAIQYQTLSRIDYDVENVKGKVAAFYDITNDSKFRTDLPAVLNLGAGYKVIDPLYLSLGFNYYFNNFAHQDSILSETDYDNSWEIAFGADYRFCKIAGASAGLSYSNQGITDSSNSTFNPVLDSMVYGAGIEFYPVERLTVTLSGMYTQYFDADYKLQENNTVLSKDVLLFSLGVTYKYF